MASSVVLVNLEYLWNYEIAHSLLEIKDYPFQT